MSNLTNLKIVSLNAQNVMRVRAVEIKPSGNVVVIGGLNEQGKTSVLESIVMAFGGGKVAPKEPVRKGAKSALIVADLDEIVVSRHFKEDGTSTLEVKSKEGARFPSPQKMLEELVGRVSFDPIHFLNLKPEQKLSTLREIVGLDFTELDKRKANAYGKRTDVNREIDKLKAKLATMPELNPAYDMDELDPVDLSRKVVAAQTADEALDDLETKGREAASLVNETKQTIADLESRLVLAKEKLEMYERQVTAYRTQYTEKKKELATLNLAELEKQLAEINDTNAKIRQHRERVQLEGDLMQKEEEFDALEKEIGDVAVEKEKMMSAAKFPIPGLSFDDTGVLYNGTPFEQASAAAKLRTSIGMAMSLNPKVKVMIIRDASLLDEHNLAIVSEMAEENDFQVWMERVGTGEECTVVIDDGEIVENRQEQVTPEPEKPKAATRKPLAGPRAKN